LLRESHIDPVAVGDIWIVRGRDRDLVIDTGSGMVAPAPLVEAIAGKPVTAVALNDYYDHATTPLRLKRLMSNIQASVTI